MADRDIRDLLRERPITVSQTFTVGETMSLLCPPGTDAGTFERARIAFGPFSASVLEGLLSVTFPARHEELQDLWTVIMNEAMPNETQRAPGGEPLPTVRTATLGWRLLALLGSAVELLTCVGEAVQSWRASGQPTGTACYLGEGLLRFQTRGAQATAELLQRFTTATYASALMGYPSRQVLERHVSSAHAELINDLCGQSATAIADIHTVSASVVEDPFWRTFMKWKHGAIGTSPGVAPVWLPEPLPADQGQIGDRLRSGIVVFDAADGPNLYIWPAQRLDFVAYVQLAMHALSVAASIAGSVWAYAAKPGTWPVAIFDIDPEWLESKSQGEALTALAMSPYPTSALAGQWRPNAP